MAVTLIRSYAGVPAGNTAEFGANVEASLIAQNMAVTAAATAITTGNVTQNTTTGVAAAAAGAGSVVVTNSLVTPQTKIEATVRQAAADGTALRVERIVPAAGSFTIYLTAGATATTLVSWALVGTDGEFVVNS